MGHNERSQPTHVSNLPGHGKPDFQISSSKPHQDRHLSKRSHTVDGSFDIEIESGDSDNLLYQYPSPRSRLSPTPTRRQQGKTANTACNQFSVPDLGMSATLQVPYSDFTDLMDQGKSSKQGYSEDGEDNSYYVPQHFGTWSRYSEGYPGPHCSPSPVLSQIRSPSVSSFRRHKAGSMHKAKRLMKFRWKEKPKNYRVLDIGGTERDSKVPYHKVSPITAAPTTGSLFSLSRAVSGLSQLTQSDGSKSASFLAWAPVYATDANGKVIYNCGVPVLEQYLSESQSNSHPLTSGYHTNPQYTTSISPLSETGPANCSQDSPVSSLDSEDRQGDELLGPPQAEHLQKLFRSKTSRPRRTYNSATRESHSLGQSMQTEDGRYQDLPEWLVPTKRDKTQHWPRRLFSHFTQRPLTGNSVGSTQNTEPDRARGPPTYSGDRIASLLPQESNLEDKYESIHPGWRGLNRLTHLFSKRSRPGAITHQETSQALTGTNELAPSTKVNTSRSIWKSQVTEELDVDRQWKLYNVIVQSENIDEILYAIGDETPRMVKAFDRMVLDGFDEDKLTGHCWSPDWWSSEQRQAWEDLEIVGSWLVHQQQQQSIYSFLNRGSLYQEQPTARHEDANDNLHGSNLDK